MSALPKYALSPSEGKTVSVQLEPPMTQISIPKSFPQHLNVGNVRCQQYGKLSKAIQEPCVLALWRFGLVWFGFASKPFFNTSKIQGQFLQSKLALQLLAGLNFQPWELMRLCGVSEDHLIGAMLKCQYASQSFQGPGGRTMPRPLGKSRTSWLK